MSLNDNIPIVNDGFTTDISELLPELTLIANDAPTGMLKNYLMKSVRLFLKRSQVQLRNMTIMLDSCVKDYPLPLLDNEVFVSFQNNEVFNNSKIYQQTEASLFKSGRYCKNVSVGWDAPNQTLHVDGKIEPFPTNQSIDIIVATTLKRSSCKVSTTIIEEYDQEIIWGALSMLYAVVGQEFTNPVMARYYDDKFKEGISAAGTDRILNRTRGVFKLINRRVV